MTTFDAHVYDPVVLVFESQQNHVIDAADHPQAVAQVNAWIEAGARWLRVSPDSCYVESSMSRKL